VDQLPPPESKSTVISPHILAQKSCFFHLRVTALPRHECPEISLGTYVAKSHRVTHSHLTFQREKPYGQNSAMESSLRDKVPGVTVEVLPFPASSSSSSNGQMLLRLATPPTSASIEKNTAPIPHLCEQDQAAACILRAAVLQVLCCFPPSSAQEFAK
jgi:hypothetical protein